MAMGDNNDYIKASSVKFGMFEGGVNYSLRSNDAAIFNIYEEFKRKEQEFKDITNLINGGLTYILNFKGAYPFDSPYVNPKIFAGEIYSCAELYGRKTDDTIKHTVNVKRLCRLDIKKLRVNYMVRLVALKQDLLNFPARLEAVCNNLNNNYRVNNSMQEVESIKKYAIKTKSQIEARLKGLDFSSVPTTDTIVALNTEINKELKSYDRRDYMRIEY